MSSLTLAPLAPPGVPLSQRVDLPIRAFSEKDAPAVEALSRLVYGDQHAAAQEWRHAAMEADGVRRYAAGVPDAPLAAYACLWNEPWLEHRRKRRLELLVDPAARGCGLGRALYTRLLADFQESGCPGLEARVSLAQPEGLSFLRRRGFVEIERDWSLRLDVAAADLSALAGAVERVNALGVEITTLAEERRTNPNWMRDFHAVFSMVVADQAAPDPSEPPPFEPFAAWLLRQEGTFDGCFLAKAGEEYVGVSMLTSRTDTPGRLLQNATGVRADLRRQGIALALKLSGIAYARSRGYGEIVTTNPSRHHSILALNERLGFERAGGWVTLEGPRS